MYFRNQFFVFTLLIGLSLAHWSQKMVAQPARMPEPAVDLRIELVSIAFRLAGNAEYNMNRFPLYVDRITAHFEPFKDHPLIHFIRNGLRPLGIGFDAPISMALSITNPPQMKPIISFDQSLPEPRWNSGAADTFLDLLNRFYRDANVETFFRENQPLYKLAAERFNEVFNELDLSWYEDFYGESPKESFHILIGLGNGGANYGPQIPDSDGNKTIYAVMGTWMVDNTGMPVYPSRNYLPTLVHELNHSFIKHLVLNYSDQLQESAQALFKPLEDKMSRQAYGHWQIMIEESLVRAAVVKYLQDHQYPGVDVEKQIADEVNRGFLWTSGLVDELICYALNRIQYPTLESYMGEICAFFMRTAGDLEQIELEINQKRPAIVDITPFRNGDQSVDPSTKRIEVVFDRPIAGNGYSIHLGDKGQDAFPEVTGIRYSEDKKTLVIEVLLKPDHFYQMFFMGTAFISAEGYGMLPFEVTFRTR